jgi:putative ABC transport system substrate-binding protein
MRICLRRREFIAGLGGAAVCPLAARAQQPPAMPVIGWLSSRDANTDNLVLPAFRQALAARGYVEGRNLKVEYRFADGMLDRLPALARDLIRSGVALVVTVGDGRPGTRAVRGVSTTIPVVFATGDDPVRVGLVPNLNRPSNNTTGVTAMQVLFASKRMGLLHQLLPSATSVVGLHQSQLGLPEWSAEIPEAQEAARQLGIQFKVLTAGTDAEIDAVFASLPRMQAEALYVGASALFFSRATRIVAQAARLAIPAVYHRREFADAGGLMSYSTDGKETYRVLGDYAGRILQGEKAGDLPVQQATRFELVINLKAARTIGLTVPPMLLALADEIIE